MVLKYADCLFVWTSLEIHRESVSLVQLFRCHHQPHRDLLQSSKVCLCTSRPAMKHLDSLTRGWMARLSCEKKRTRDVEECQPMLPLARKTSRQKALTVDRSRQQVKACTQSVFVSASHMHIKTPGVLVLSLLLLLPLWSTSPSFSPPWLFS